MRTFIAIDFSPELIQKIVNVVQFFKTQTPDNDIKWVSPKNLHLTIKFLGEVHEKNLERIKSLMTQSLKNTQTFTIAIEGLGMYPNQQKPRVVWLGIKRAEPLNEIYKVLDHALTETDIKSEKRGFSPHLTIGRLRRNTDIDTVQIIGKTLSKFKVDSLGTCTVDHVVLYKSELTPQGPIYTSLLSCPLNKV